MTDSDPYNHNSLLVELLDLQQDGNSAISAPQNWQSEPLFYTRTDVDIEIDRAIEIIKENENKEGIWLFLIGAPGNGKSALAGRIARALLQDKFCFFEPDYHDNTKNKPEFKFNNTESLPYLLEVFDKQTKKFSICSFIQDASVVKDRYSKNITPAKDLIETCIDCYKKGKSLIVCANRGVIEDIDRVKNDFNDEDRKIINKVFSVINKGKGKLPIPDKGPSVNSEIGFKKFSLENKSLLQQNDTFNSLITSACVDLEWQKCESCKSMDFCPFYQNRQDLLVEKIRNNFITILKQYESYSGQTIVFREAIAILSFVLTGLIDDYIEFDGSPCKWVNKMVETQSWFELIGRRIYISMYSPYAPFLIDYEMKNSLLRDTTIKKIIGKKTIRKLSLNTGLNRFFSNQGIANEIHPSKNIEIPLRSIDLSMKILADTKFKNFEMIRILEKKLFELFEAIEDKMPDSDDLLVNKTYNLVRKWGIGYFLHISFFTGGYTRFSQELEELSKINSFEPRSKECINIKKKIGSSLVELLNSGEVELNQNTTVINLEQTPFIRSFKEIENMEIKNPLGVYVSFKKDAADLIFIEGKTFCFLLNKAKLKLSNLTFPAELIDQLKYHQIMVARQSDYNLRENIRLKIKTDKGDQVIERDNYGHINFL